MLQCKTVIKWIFAQALVSFITWFKYGTWKGFKQWSDHEGHSRS